MQLLGIHACRLHQPLWLLSEVPEPEYLTAHISTSHCQKIVFLNELILQCFVSPFQKETSKKDGICTFCTLQLECHCGFWIGLQTVLYRRHFNYLFTTSAHAKTDNRTARYTQFCDRPNIQGIPQWYLSWEITFLPWLRPCPVRGHPLLCATQRFEEEKKRGKRRKK